MIILLIQFYLLQNLVKILIHVIHQRGECHKLETQFKRGG